MLVLLALSHTLLASCPDGDVAGGLTDLVPDVASLTLRVDVDGVGHLRFHLPWKNESEGPGSASVRFDSDVLAVQGARVVGGDDADLVEASDAMTSWDAFVTALENGVDQEQERPGARRFGLHVNHGDDGCCGGSNSISVDVAGACSVRSLVADVDALIDPLPAAGGWRFELPAPFARATLRVEAPRDHLVYVDGKRSSRGAREESDPFVVDVSRPGPSIRARGGAIVLEPKAAPKAETATSSTPFTLVRAAIDLPEPLSAAPPELRVVFVVDTSVSAGDNGVAMALAVVTAYLDEAPDDVGWALVTSSRTPQLLIPPWRTKEQRHLPALALENGSDVVAAVALAQKIAADALPGRGRVVVLSDLQLSTHLEAILPAQISSGGGHGPLVHVVQLPADVDDGEHVRVGFDRVFATDDVTAFAVGRTGGVLLSAFDQGDAGSVLELGRYLVRPTRLDQPVLLLDGHDIQERATTTTTHVFAGGAGTSEGELPLALLEGGGARVSVLLEGRAHTATVAGLLWATPVEVPLTSTRFSRALDLSIMANADLAVDLDDDQVRAAAFAGHFVSRVTSLVDVPAWRPAEPQTLYGHGCGGCGCCGGHSGTSHCGGCTLRTGRAVHTQDILDDMAAEAAEQCRAKQVDVEVEFGDREILDVKADRGGACAAEWFWRQRLDEHSDDTSFEAHARLHARFGVAAADADKR